MTSINVVLTPNSTHQDLLKAYFQAAEGVIWEYSTQIKSDTDELRKSVREYAKAHNLDTGFIKDEDDSY